MVVATGVGSLAALVALIQTPATSVLFGSRPLGPIGLAQAAAAAGAASAVAYALPKWRERRKAEGEVMPPPAAEGPIERARRAFTKLRDDAIANRKSGMRTTT